MLAESRDRIQSLPELTVEQKVVVLNFLLDTDVEEFFERNQCVEGQIPFSALCEFVAVDPVTKPGDSSVRETANKFVHNCWDSWKSPHKKSLDSGPRNNLMDYDTFIHFAFDRVPLNHSRGGPAKWQIVPMSELNWNELVVGLSGIRDTVHSELVKNNIRLQKEVNSWRNDSGKVLGNNQDLMSQIEEIREEADSQIAALNLQLEEYYFKNTDLESQIAEITKDAEKKIRELTLYLEEADEQNNKFKAELRDVNRSIVADKIEYRKKIEKLEKSEIELERSRQLNSRLSKQIENLKEKSEPHQNGNGANEPEKNLQNKNRGAVDKVQEVPTWSKLHLSIMKLVLYGNKGSAMTFAEVGEKLGISETQVMIAFEDAQDRFQIWLDDVAPKLVNSEIIEEYFFPKDSEIVYEDHEEEKDDLNSVNVD